MDQVSQSVSLAEKYPLSALIYRRKISPSKAPENGPFLTKTSGLCDTDAVLGLETAVFPDFAHSS